MFGDFVGRGSAGGVFTSPTDSNQVIKIMNLDSRDEMVRHMNRLQLRFFEQLEEQQKQGTKTPGLPNISYTFTGDMSPQIMNQMRDAILERNSLYPEDDYLSGLDYADIKAKFRYGDQYAIVLMDRVGQIGSRNFDNMEPLGRRGLTPMLRHAHKMGYYVRDLWPENKGMSASGDIVWFDPMVVPINAKTEEDRRAQQILLEWNDDTQSRYQDAVLDGTYFDYEHKAGLFYSEDEDDNYWLRGGCGQAASAISEELDRKKIPYGYEIGLAYMDDAFVGNHIIVVVEGKDIDYYGDSGAKQRWEDMMLSDYGLEGLPRSVTDDTMRFVWTPVDPATDWGVEVEGSYQPVTGSRIDKDTLGMSAESGQEIKEYITSIHDGDFLWLDSWDDLEFTLQTLPMEIFEDYRNQDYPDGAWEDSPVSSRRLEDTLNQFRWSGDGYPAVVLELDENGFYEIIDGYHRLNALQILGYDTVDAWVGKPVLSHSAESYPTCYLCPKPAKVEVMTAVGMRNFCGNRCRGEYEGIDYGPDDYYVSPKLEHRIDISNYDPGDTDYDYSRDATIDAKCANCDFTVSDGSFYRPHPFGKIKEYDEEDEEYYEVGRCRHENMIFVRYLENDEDAYGNVMLGEITVRCPDCGFADILQADIPIGCDNKGRSENYLRFGI